MTGKKVVVLGNSASGKSTLARKLCTQESLAHLDLDNLAWQALSPGSSVPLRRNLDESGTEILSFMATHRNWVIEGCYADLLAVATPEATELIYLTIPVEICVDNARKRPWEPHKYASKEDQDKNLNMLIDWIRAYETREDTFSESAHQQLYAAFPGDKRRITELVPLP
ncbi:MAG: AAA family ATPase [Congregibacter sp.]